MSLPKRCVDLTEDDIDEGLKSVQKMRVLLEHMARIAKPNEGAAKMLVAISRIATTACEWLEGTLHVEVDEIIGASEIAVMSDLGGGMRELILPRLLVGVEYEELVRAVKLAPRLIWPLKFRVRGERMVLKRDMPGTVAPPAFEIAEESLRRSLSPKLRRSLPPIQKAKDADAAPESTVEGAILARILPKTARALVIDEVANLDMGWDFSGVSSAVTKPPPAAKRPSKLPTLRPAEMDAAADRPPRSTKKPPGKPSKLPPKPAPKPSKAPPKPQPKKPVIRKIRKP